jgi:MoaA/NifB/PqqE/SkfB family radical SAM enzyme
VPCDLGSRGEGIHVLWEITAGCNLACLHCSVPRNPAGRRLSPERAKEVLGELVEAGVRRISFTGGEPLLRGDLWSLVEEAIRLGIEAEVLTNGMLLEEEDVAAAAAASRGGELTLLISLDSARDWVHDGIRGRRGAFTATLDGIRRVREAGLRVALQMVLTRRNRFEVAPLVDLAASLEVESVTFRKLIVAEDGRGSAEEIRLGPEERAGLLQEIRSLREAYPDGPVLRTAGLGVLPEEDTCGAARGVVAIDGEGMVHPCVLLRMEHHGSRDLRERSAAEILSEPTLDHLAAPRRPGCL